jgi:hypothetical protein
VNLGRIVFPPKKDKMDKEENMENARYATNDDSPF